LEDSNSPEGNKFWSNVFLGIYPESSEKSSSYGGDIKDFPVEIVERMLECQELQHGKRKC
jgi:hypothetical protein